MFELVPYLFYVFLAISVSRSCAVLFARRETEKTPGEELMAKLAILPSRDLATAQNTFHACFSVLRGGGVRRPTGLVVLLHFFLWIAFVILLLAIGFGPFLKML
jgi:hypothetical protein